MLVIHTRNVHDGLPEALYHMRARGVERDSRNGKVVYIPEPVTTVYAKPLERVLFWPERDANPFFHLYEALWMLGGRNDVKSLTRFVKRMDQFSDDGVTFHGAYGKRWRGHFGTADYVIPLDQPLIIGKRLLQDSNNRRQVLQMYDAHCDFENQEGKRDIPCNLSAVFQINHEHELDMMVTNRSNDIIWGCYGANAVHFSMLQEFVAGVAGVPVGRYWQVSFNWHGYLETMDPLIELADRAFQAHRVVQWASPYESKCEPYPLMHVNPETWLADLNMFLDEEDRAMGYRDRFFRKVALPMMRVHNIYKSDSVRPTNYIAALGACKTIRATDWQLAATEWIQRRYDKWQTR
jgi:thymidylate synthase